MMRNVVCLSIAVMQLCAVVPLAADIQLPTIEPSALPATPFRAVAPGTSGRSSGLYGNFTFAGPVAGSFTALPQGVFEVVQDNAGHRLGAGNGEAYQLLGTQGQPLVPPSSVDLSWLMGATFDSNRNRFVLATLVGEGALYSVNPATNAFGSIRSLNNIDLTGIAYSPANDRLYGVGGPGRASTLYEFDNTGMLLRSDRIDIPSISNFMDRFNQLFAVDGYLAYLQYLGPTQRPTIHAIDLSTRQAYLVIPEPSTWLLALAGFTGLAIVWSSSRRQKLHPEHRQ
jgi:hypothetical protein